MTLEIGAEIGPTGSPGLGAFRAFLVPALPKGVQSIQIGYRGFQERVGYTLTGIAQLVDDVVLDLGLGEGSTNRRITPC